MKVRGQRRAAAMVPEPWLQDVPGEARFKESQREVGPTVKKVQVSHPQGMRRHELLRVETVGSDRAYNCSVHEPCLRCWCQHAGAEAQQVTSKAH